MSTPVGPYTPLVRAGDLLVASGQLGLTDGGLAEGGVAGQLRQAIANHRKVKKLLRAWESQTQRLIELDAPE